MQNVLIMENLKKIVVRNGIKGVLHPCGWFSPFITIPRQQPSQNTETEFLTTKEEKRIAALPIGDDGIDYWYEYCLSKYFGVPEE